MTKYLNTKEEAKKFLDEGHVLAFCDDWGWWYLVKKNDKYWDIKSRYFVSEIKNFQQCYVADEEQASEMKAQSDDTFEPFKEDPDAPKNYISFEVYGSHCIIKKIFQFGLEADLNEGQSMKQYLFMKTSMTPEQFLSQHLTKGEIASLKISNIESYSNLLTFKWSKEKALEKVKHSIKEWNLHHG